MNKTETSTTKRERERKSVNFKNKFKFLKSFEETKAVNKHWVCYFELF
jgi:hypothetical protein